MSAADVTPPTKPAPTPTPPTTSPTQTTHPTDGPLRTLVQKAAATPLVQRCRQNVPAFASDAVSRTASKADAVLTKVDSKLTQAGERLDTNEGKQLVAEATNLYNSLLTFLTVFSMAVVSFAEKALDVKYDVDQAPSCADRVRTVGKIVWGKLADSFDKREKQVEGTVEAEVYARGRWFVGVVIAVTVCVLGALKDYSGPAKEYVAPFAEKLLTIMPQAQNSVDANMVEQAEQASARKDQ